MQATFTVRDGWEGREDGRLPTITVLTESDRVSLQVEVPDDRGPFPVLATTFGLTKSTARAIASALMGAAAEL